MELQLNPTRITRTLITLMLVLLLAHVLMLVTYFQIGDPQKMDFWYIIDMDSENNFPTFFSVALLLIATLLAHLSAKADHSLSIYWMALSLLLLLMAIDESLSLHEEYVGPWTDLLLEHYGMVASGYLYYAWIIPYGLMVMFIGAFFLRFLWQLPRPVAIRLIISGLIFLTGAIGMEMLAGNEVTQANDSNSAYYRVLSTIEETLEMSGVILLCHTLLNNLMRMDVKLQLASTS